MKKIFISISAVLMVVVIALIISICTITKNVRIECDKPATIRVYNESTSPIKSTGFKSSDAQYDVIYDKVNEMTDISLVNRLLKLKTLHTKVEISKDGTFVKWTPELKSENIVVEFEFDEEQDAVVYDEGHTRVISYWCLAFVITKTSDFEDIIVYYSTTNSSDARDESYAKSEPMILRGYAGELIEYVEELQKSIEATK